MLPNCWKWDTQGAELSVLRAIISLCWTQDSAGGPGDWAECALPPPPAGHHHRGGGGLEAGGPAAADQQSGGLLAAGAGGPHTGQSVQHFDKIRNLFTCKTYFRYTWFWIYIKSWLRENLKAYHSISTISYCCCTTTEYVRKHLLLVWFM